MKKFKEIIEGFNEMLPINISNYKFILEKTFDVYKLSSTKNVIQYSTINENELESFEKKARFFYYLQQSDINIYVLITNKKTGNTTKHIIGYITSDKLNLINFHSILKCKNFKKLKKFLKNKFEVSTEKYFPYKICLTNFLKKNDISEKEFEYVKYSKPQMKEMYSVVYNNGKIHEVEKEKSYNVMEYIINNNLKIESLNKKILYIY